MEPVPTEDRFTLWYRFRTTVIFNLLQVIGPAHLDDGRDPRTQVEREYLRRRALHRGRKLGLAPSEITIPEPTRQEFDPLVALAVVGVLALLGLIAWAYVSSR